MLNADPIRVDYATACAIGRATAVQVIDKMATCQNPTILLHAARDVLAEDEGVQIGFFHEIGERLIAAETLLVESISPEQARAEFPGF